MLPAAAGAARAAELATSRGTHAAALGVAERYVALRYCAGEVQTASGEGSEESGGSGAHGSASPASPSLRRMHVSAARGGTAVATQARARARDTQIHDVALDGARMRLDWGLPMSYAELARGATTSGFWEVDAAAALPAVALPAAAIPASRFPSPSEWRSDADADDVEGGVESGEDGAEGVASEEEVEDVASVALVSPPRLRRMSLRQYAPFTVVEQADLAALAGRDPGLGLPARLARARVVAAAGRCPQHPLHAAPRVGAGMLCASCWEAAQRPDSGTGALVLVFGGRAARSVVS